MTSNTMQKPGVKTRLEDILYGRRRSPVLESLLLLLSLVYRAALRIRSGLYRSGIWSARSLPVPVISIGNITLGGTGKTPMVIAVAGLLAKHGRHPAVVSRGYGRRDESRVTVVSDGLVLRADAGTGGDEPVLIASSLAGVPVVAGADRYQAAGYALEQFHADTVIMDDGFQHRRLARNKDIVLIDALNPFGNGRLFPAGILREPLDALARANAVVLTRCESAPSPADIRQQVARVTAAPVFTCRAKPLCLVDTAGTATRPLADLAHARVAAFAGIASPEQFFRMITGLGADIAWKRVFPDHHAYSAEDIAGIRRDAQEQGVQWIVTTEKDLVRLRGLELRDVFALRIEFVVDEHEAWKSFLLEKA